jgi:hypothetical protein
MALRTADGRILVTTAAGIALAGVGAAIGAGIGLATGGAGVAATVPLAAVGLVVGAGAGYLIGDKLVDRPWCPSCRAEISLNL